MTDLAKSLPNHETITEWLGGPESGWTMLDGMGEPAHPDAWNEAPFPCPWMQPAGRGALTFECRLLHTDGTRVTVRAPERLLSPVMWQLWFERIADRIGVVNSDYDKHVTWQHPQPATDLGECAACGARAAVNPVSSHVVDYCGHKLCVACWDVPCHQLNAAIRARQSEVVELGTLELWDHFRYDASDRGMVSPKYFGGVCRVVSLDIAEWPTIRCLDNGETFESNPHRRVRRVPPPQTSTVVMSGQRAGKMAALKATHPDAVVLTSNQGGGEIYQTHHWSKPLTISRSDFEQATGRKDSKQGSGAEVEALDNTARVRHGASGTTVPRVRSPIEPSVRDGAETLRRMTCSTKDCHNPATVDGLCGSCRWPGVAAERWPGFETLLAQQVASGGQSGAAARAMLVRRDNQLALLELQNHHGFSDESPVASETAGIRGLKLERPLISWKRKR